MLRNPKQSPVRGVQFSAIEFKICLFFDGAEDIEAQRSLETDHQSDGQSFAHPYLIYSRE